MVSELKYESPECEIIACTKGIDEELFRELRKNGIGGSDAGPIMDLSDYGSAFTVVSDKLGNGVFADNKATRRGKRMEPVIRENLAGWAAEIEGVPVEVYEVFESPYLYRSVKYPWMVANIDGLVRHRDHGLCVLEIKTADPRLPEENWADNSIPDTYYAQVQHYMAVLGLNMAIVMVMIGLDPEIRYVARNDAFIADMIEAERVVWIEYVEKKLLPEPTGKKKEMEILGEMYPVSTVESIDVQDMRELAARHVYISGEIKAYEAEKQAINAKFKARLGKAKKGIVSGFNVNWSRFKQKYFDQARFEAENPELAAQYTTQEDSGRFTITAEKEKKEK